MDLPRKDTVNGAFIRVVLQLDVDFCILWPFSTGRYAGVQLQPGQRTSVHRLIAEVVHGAPDPGMDASHTCHQSLCVNRNHIVWETHQENLLRRRESGRLKLGEQHHNARLTEQDVREIRHSLAQGVSYTQLGRDYGVSRQSIKNIHAGKTWFWL